MTASCANKLIYKTVMFFEEKGASDQSGFVYNRIGLDSIEVLN